MILTGHEVERQVGLGRILVSPFDRSRCTGHAGSISTLHASSALHALNRLARLALQADTGLPFSSIQSEIADAMQYVAHIERRGTRREVTELIRVTGFHSDTGAWQFVPLDKAVACE